MEKPRNFVELVMRRCQRFSLFFSCFFGLLLLDLFSARVGVLGSFTANHAFMRLFAMQPTNSSFAITGTFLVINLILFSAATVWRRFFL